MHRPTLIGLEERVGVSLFGRLHGCQSRCRFSWTVPDQSMGGWLPVELFFPTLDQSYMGTFHFFSRTWFYCQVRRSTVYHTLAQCRWLGPVYRICQHVAPPPLLLLAFSSEFGSNVDGEVVHLTRKFPDLGFGLLFLFEASGTGRLWCHMASNSNKGSK